MEKFRNWIKKIFMMQNTLVVFLFASMLAVILCLLFLPKTEFSEQENRMLQQFPKISWTSIGDGSFMEEMGDFVGDQFPARRFFVSLNTAVCWMEGNKDIGGNYSKTPAEGGVYFGKQGHLYEVLLPSKNSTYKKNISGLISFSLKSGIPLYILPVPSGAAEQEENLPYSCPDHDQREEFRELQAGAEGNVKVIDLFDDLSLQKTGRDYYFKTDHHWNTYGAYVGYTELCKAMKIPCTPLSQFSLRTDGQPFFGTLYSKALDAWQKPDSFVLPYKKDGWTLTQETNGSVRKDIYWNQYLTQKDKYSVYLGGNPAVTVVKNSAAGKGKILLLKDSYANSMIPYLATNFSEIHLIDLRYYNQNIYDYIQQNGIKQAAAIYSFSQLSEVPIANKLLR